MLFYNNESVEKWHGTRCITFMSFLCVKLLVFLGEDCSHIRALLVLVDELDNVFDITPDDFLLPFADDHNYSVSVWCLVDHERCFCGP